MTDLEDRLDVLRAEWLARHEAALKRRTAARLAAAETAFRAYSAHLAARVPAPRPSLDAAAPSARPAAATP
ncbi:MAG TPA: hypothetical protein VNU66_03930 [Mycobacteriales bacterium]|nr:hypothetical protein [Mycobacteriales bacterium]